MTLRNRLEAIGTKSDSGGVTVTWTNKDVLTELATAIKKDLLEIIGEDEIDFPENKANQWTYPKIRNRQRAELRTALNNYVGGDDE